MLYETGISLTQWYPPPGKNSVVSYKDSWEDCSKCMGKFSEQNIHWFWRYSSGRSKFSNILSIWDNKNGDKSAILNLILKKLHRIHGKIVVNACVKYWKPIFIGVGRYSSGRTKFLNILSIWANKNGEKSTILNLILKKLHRIHGRMVVNACVEFLEEMFIGVGDIYPDGKHFKIFLSIWANKNGDKSSILN